MDPGLPAPLHCGDARVTSSRLRRDTDVEKLVGGSFSQSRRPSRCRRRTRNPIPGEAFHGCLFPPIATHEERSLAIYMWLPTGDRATESEAGMAMGPADQRSPAKPEGKGSLSVRLSLLSPRHATLINGPPPFPITNPCLLNVPCIAGKEGEHRIPSGGRVSPGPDLTSPHRPVGIGQSKGAKTKSQIPPPPIRP